MAVQSLPRFQGENGMFTQFEAAKWLTVPGLTMALMMVGGCKAVPVEDDEAATYTANAYDYPPPCTQSEFILNGWQCPDSSSSGGTGTSSGSTDGLSGSSGGSSQNSSGIALLMNTELEPNDTLSAANPVAYASRSDTITHVGWLARGSVSDSADAIDHFTFTAPVDHEYVMRLCPGAEATCHSTTGLDTLTVFFDLLDADGNVLLSSQAAATNSYLVAIDAGVVYYVRVTAADTLGEYVAYDLQAFERKW
jgi:hypothetical protein